MCERMHSENELYDPVQSEYFFLCIDFIHADIFECCEAKECDKVIVISIASKLYDKRYHTSDDLVVSRFSCAALFRRGCALLCAGFSASCSTKIIKQIDDSARIVVSKRNQESISIDRRSRKKHVFYAARRLHLTLD